MIPLRNAARFVNKHRNEHIEKVRQFGYRFRYRTETHKRTTELFIEVTNDDRLVARANFTDFQELCSQNVFVDPAHRRKGIATAMYVFAELYFSKSLYPLWDANEQTAESQALWKQPNRPFGPRRNKITQ
jgi:GNAT superfamily N-acetyltransferase